MTTPLTQVQARAKVIASKARLKSVSPFVASFLQLFPVAISTTPKVFPAYVRPVPECVLAHRAVEELHLSELAVIQLHEAFHVFFDVFGMMASGLDPDILPTAQDLYINILINDEINRLNRLGLNGNDVQSALLAWPRAYPPQLDYRFVGMTIMQIYTVLMQEREEGKQGYDQHGDCPQEDFTPEQIAQGHAHVRRAALRASEEATTAGGDEGPLQALVFRILRPVLPWPRVLAARIGEAGKHLETRSFLALNPADTSDEDGILMPGVRMEGESIMVAPDSSISTVADGLMHRFMAEVQGAARSFEGPVRVAPWDTQVRRDVMLDESNLKRALTGVQVGGNTDVWCLLRHLNKPPAAVQDHPEPALLVILTDGRIESWPPASAWPCEVLVAYTHKAPPSDYASLLLEGSAA